MQRRAKSRNLKNISRNRDKNTIEIQRINLIIKPQWGIIYTRGRGKAQNQTARERRKSMEEMNTAELLKETAEENQTRKILGIMKESQTLEEAIQKTEALLNK